MPLSASTRKQIAALRDRYPQPRSAILPCLWAVQNEVGYLSTAGMSEVATILKLAPSEVQAVSTFYSMYFKRPAGDHHVLICVNVSCALRGADDLVTHVERRLGVPSGGTTADQKFTWESTVECLGACGGAPAMQIDYHFHEDLTPERVDGILDRVGATPSGHVRREQAPPTGPHPPTAETPPPSTAEGPPAAAGATADGDPVREARGAPTIEQTEMPGSRTEPTANPQGSRSRPRKNRPRPDADGL